jgi:hypothetical protein
MCTISAHTIFMISIAWYCLYFCHYIGPLVFDIPKAAVLMGGSLILTFALVTDFDYQT